MQGKRMRFSGFLNFLLLACYVLPAAAADWTDAELKAMPPFCEARLKHTPGQYDYWYKTLGEEFIWTNHYCEGIGYLNRSYSARNQREAKAMLGTAYRGIDYLMAQVKPTSSLMPEIYLNRGLVLSLQGNNGAAVGDLKRALELNPKLVKAYTLSSDIHAKLNQKKEALAVVTDGLRHVPDSSALQRIYKERGGKLPYPEPITSAADVKAVPAETNHESGASEVEGKPQDGIQPAPASATPDAAGGGAAAVLAPAAPKIGSPTNPWCRFCPDPVK
jgi:tetratricopeptide (TPR) repeat protein